MAVKLKIKVPEIIPGTDHDDLINRGDRTHMELDDIYEEVIEARGESISLKAKIQKVFDSIIRKHSDLDEVGVKSHDSLDELWVDVDMAKKKEDGTSFISLKEKLDSLKPKLKLMDLEDVNLDGIKNKQTLVWNEQEKLFKPGNAISEGGGGGGTPTKLNFEITPKYEFGFLMEEVYTGDLNKRVLYKYNGGLVTSKEVIWDSGEVFICNYSYDNDENIIKVVDTGTEEIIVSSNSGGEIPDGLMTIIKNLESKITSTTKSILQMQFKYDIALNLTKNKCSDFFIDVLQDASNIESYEGCSYNSTDETIF